MSDITRKETIQILKQLSPKCCIDPYKIGQALEFAINSLEVDEAYQLEYEATTQPSVEDFIRFAEKKFDVKLHITEIKKHQSDFSDLGKSNNVTIKDCISRQAVLDLINADWKYENLEIEINNLPSVTPQPKHGIWQQINKNEVNVIPEYKCSECGAEYKGFEFDFDYCPRCGCAMKEEE